MGEPSRRGFGSSLIEQAVPFELGGRSDLRFDYGGVSVELFIPKNVLDLRSLKNTRAIEPTELQRTSEVPDDLTAGIVLVVEDNFIIANDLAATLRELGVSAIETAANQEDARNILVGLPIDLAILDVNLGIHSSGALGIEIHAAGIPLFFITGYMGSKRTFRTNFPNVPCSTSQEPLHELLECVEIQGLGDSFVSAKAFREVEQIDLAERSGRT